MSTKNEQGKKYDQDKPRWDLTPWSALNEIVKVLTFGAAKYGDENWRAVTNSKRRYTAAALRHVVAWITGERNDPESGYHHLAHAACCILFLLDPEVQNQITDTVKVEHITLTDVKDQQK